MNRYLIILLGASLLAISSCQNRTNKPKQDTWVAMRKYDWIPTECAPAEYPVEIYSGGFFYGSNNNIDMPNGSIVKNGWGETGSIRIGGDDRKEAPDLLKLSWISFAENRSYSGSFKLNKHLIDSLFGKGFETDYGTGHDTYSTIKVGMAPGGVVVIWLEGGRFQVEVGRFQAKEVTAFDWKERYPNMNGTFNDYRNRVLSKLPANVRKKITENKITYGIWDKWRQRYLWNPVFIATYTLQKVEISYFNKERIDFYDKQIDNLAPRLSAVPNEIAVFWRDMKHQELVTTIDFDEQEAYQLFKQINDQKATLNLKLNLKNSIVDIVLRTGDKEQVVRKVNIQTYSK
jgi:hypothetical protein